MENPKHPTLFSRYGQRRLGSELLDYLRAAEVAGDADASAELGSAYLDANGVEFDPERALHHFQKGAARGNKFCQFRIAEYQLKSGLTNNPLSTSSHRQNYDIIWACAKGGVGEAFVTLHFLHAQFRQDPLGYPTWIRPEAEKSVALFLHALKNCYDYLDGGPADQCATALEMLAREGFSPAYWTASIVASDGCKDIARSRTNLVSAVKNGVAEAIEHFANHPEDIDCPSTRFDLLTIAAGHGHAGAWFLLMSVKKARGLPEELIVSESWAFVHHSPRWFSHTSLKCLETFCSLGEELQEEAPRVQRILASLGFQNSICCLHSAKLVSGDNLLENYEHLEVADQLELAKDIGAIFMAALKGSPEAWLLATRAHANGTLAGHGPLGLSEGQHPAAGAITIMGTVYEKLSDKTILSDELRIPEAEQHASKEIAQISRHVAHMMQMHTYGLGYMPSSRLLHDCTACSGDACPTDYPWQISYPPITPSWPASPATMSIKVSRNPFVKKWIHPEGINDPLCHAMRHQLDNGNLSGAKQCLRFDKDLIPRLLTLAAGLYEAGHKLECSELLAFGIFHLKGQTGLAHRMLAWVYHELGRTSEAIRIAYDNLGFPELCNSSDSHHVEFHLLLAEMLLLMNRSLEAAEVLKKLRALASNDSVILDRCEQLNRTDYLFSNLMWNMNNKKGDSFVTVDRHNPDIKMYTLALTNMDRYRRIFPIKFAASMTTNDNHRSWARYYDEVNRRCFGEFYDLLTQQTLHQIGTLGNSLRIVDFGAGTGRLSVPLSALGHQVTAVEPSKAMLERLHAKNVDGRITTHNASLSSYAGPGGHDLALAVFTVIAYVLTPEELTASFANAFRCLTPDGALLVDVPRAVLFTNNHARAPGLNRDITFTSLGNGLFRYHESTRLMTNEGLVQYQDTFNLRHWTTDEVKAALSAAGLKVAEDWSARFPMAGAEYWLCKRERA